MAKTIMVGMGEIHVACERGDVLCALGLGSCIGVCAYDPYKRVAGMAHVVLPGQIGGQMPMPGKFADTAIPAMVAQMELLGAAARHVRVAIAGGAELFSFKGGATMLEIGKRNCEAVVEALQRQKLQVVAQDLRGTVGRSVRLYVEDGLVRVKTIGQGERDLILLGEAIDRQAVKAA